MPFLGTTGGASVKQYGGQANLGYFIKNSLRFRASATAYLNITPSSSTNRRISTFSAWVKWSLTGSSAFPEIFSAAPNGSTYKDAFYFSSNTLAIIFNGGVSYSLVTTQVFRDPSAWYHFVMAIDTTQATASNRVKLYVNGTQVTAFGTANYPTQNYDPNFNSAIVHNIGRSTDANDYYDGYLTEVNFVDGQALIPSSFGKTDAVTGQWVPKKFTGAYGTNGFYLKFADASAATAAAIGKDSSSNGNNWTPNNISVTAGTTYDAMIDSPTLSAVASNYAVLNPVNVSGGGTTTITNGNLATSVGSTTTFGKVLGSIGMSTGKWYWEVTVTAIGGAGNIGIGDGTPPSGSFGLGGVAGELSYQSTGNKYTNNSGTAYGASYTTNDIIGVAYDADAGSITFYKNNSSQGAITGFSGTKFAAVGSGGGTNPQYTVNFGQQPFTYTPPSGFKSLNTFNLP